jgi:hypothetical protein
VSDGAGASHCKPVEQLDAMTGAVVRRLVFYCILACTSSLIRGSILMICIVLYSQSTFSLG